MRTLFLGTKAVIAKRSRCTTLNQMSKSQTMPTACITMPRLQASSDAVALLSVPVLLRPCGNAAEKARLQNLSISFRSHHSMIMIIVRSMCLTSLCKGTACYCDRIAVCVKVLHASSMTKRHDGSTHQSDSNQANLADCRQPPNAKIIVVKARPLWPLGALLSNNVCSECDSDHTTTQS